MMIIIIIIIPPTCTTLYTIYINTWIYIYYVDKCYLPHAVYIVYEVPQSPPILPRLPKYATAATLQHYHDDVIVKPNANFCRHLKSFCVIPSYKSIKSAHVLVCVCKEKLYSNNTFVSSTLTLLQFFWPSVYMIKSGINDVSYYT